MSTGITGGNSLHQQADGVHENDAPHLGQTLMVPVVSVSIMRCKSKQSGRKIRFCIIALLFA